MNTVTATAEGLSALQAKLTKQFELLEWITQMQPQLRSGNFGIIEAALHQKAIIITCQQSDLYSLANCQKFGVEILAVCYSHPKRKIILSLQAVNRIRDIGIGFLIIAHQKIVKENGSRFILTEVHPNVMSTLHTKKLDRLFEIVDNQEAALASLTPPS